MDLGLVVSYSSLCVTLDSEVGLKTETGIQGVELMGHQGEKDMRITENISIMLNCQNMIQGKCQEMAPRKTLQKP